MEASHKTHRPHIKVGKDEEEEDINPVQYLSSINNKYQSGRLTYLGIMLIIFIIILVNFFNYKYILFYLIIAHG